MEGATVETDDVLLLLDRAKKALAKKSYGHALSLYDAALRRPSIAEGEAAMSALDQRAACNVLLKDLSSALRDAKKMIGMDKRDPRGYLRCAQILVYQNDNDQALRVVRAGRSRVDRERAAWQTNNRTLESLYARLLKAEKSRRDPAIMAPELFQMVMTDFDVWELLKLRQVSRTWKTLLENTPRLWRMLDLDALNGNPVPQRPLKSIVDYARGQIEELRMKSLCGNSRFPEAAIDMLLQQCPRLKCLELAIRNRPLLSYIGKIPTLHLTSLVFDHSFSYEADPSNVETLHRYARVLANFPKLEHVKIRGFIPREGPVPWPQTLLNLKTMELTAYDMVGIPFPLQLLAPEALAEAAPNLEWLCLAGFEQRMFCDGPDFSSFKKLKGFQLSTPKEVCLPPLPESLEELDINIQRGQRVRLLEHSQGFSSYLPKLKTLHCCLYMIRSTGPLLRQTIEDSKCPLEVLTLEDRYYEENLESGQPPLAITEIATALLSNDLLSALRKLSLIGAPNVHFNDEFAQLVAEHCPALEEMEIGERSDMTGLGVSALLRKPGCKLRLLDVGIALNMNIDVRPFARSQGVTLLGKIGSGDVGKGRKIRS